MGCSLDYSYSMASIRPERKGLCGTRNNPLQGGQSGDVDKAEKQDDHYDVPVSFPYSIWQTYDIRCQCDTDTYGDRVIKDDEVSHNQ